MKVINLTPHKIVLFSQDNQVLAEFPSEGIARASMSTEEVEVDGFPYRLTRNTYGEVMGLPAYEDGTFYILSALTVSAAKSQGRRCDDLLITSDPVRDEEGRIIGCKAFALM